MGLGLGLRVRVGSRVRRLVILMEVGKQRPELRLFGTWFGLGFGLGLDVAATRHPLTLN